MESPADYLIRQFTDDRRRCQQIAARLEQIAKPTVREEAELRRVQESIARLDREIEGLKGRKAREAEAAQEAA